MKDEIETSGVGVREAFAYSGKFCVEHHTVTGRTAQGRTWEPVHLAFLKGYRLGIEACASQSEGDQRMKK